MSTLRDLQQATGGTLRLFEGDAGGGLDHALGPVVTDSRRVEPGWIYWALAGAGQDGADSVQEAFARGAAGAVVRRQADPPAGRWVLQVPDPLQALRQWAAWQRRQFRGTLIALTGSLGRSTARQMIHTVLQTRLRGIATPGACDSRIGLPLSIFEAQSQPDYAVLELQANSRSQMAALAELCAPAIGVIIRAGQTGPEPFGSRQRTAQIWAELLAALPPEGHALVGEDPWLRRQASRCRAPITWVGTAAQCDLAPEDLKFVQGRLSFRLEGCWFSIPGCGPHHLLAALVAIGVGRLLGIAPQEAASALNRYEAVPAHCQVREIRGATIINDPAAGDPGGMRAALELLRDFEAPGRRIVVCGQMAQAGGHAPLVYARLGSQVVTLCQADLLIACGQQAGQVVAGARTAGMPQTRAIACRRPEDALPYLGQAVLPGDVVLLTGLGSVGIERIMDALHRYPRRRTA